MGSCLGFLYIVIAEGLSIIFGMIGIVNFAHGAFFALGAYFAMTLAAAGRRRGDQSFWRRLSLALRA